MRTHDRSVEGDLALRDVAIMALVVIDLRSARVVGLGTIGKAGGEIDVIVAGATGRARGLAKNAVAWAAPVVWL